MGFSPVNTKDRILLTALALFNEEGESAISAVDIANGLEMSPGNLYYHFKGKDEIVPALLSAFHEELLLVLDFAQTETTDLERYWIYLYIILEEIYDFRFFYLNIERIMAVYPQTQARVRRIMAAKRSAVELVLDGLARNGMIEIPKAVKNDVIETVLMTMTFWLTFDALNPQEIPKEELIHQAVFRVMTIILPYQTQPFDLAFQGLENQREGGKAKARKRRSSRSK